MTSFGCDFRGVCLLVSFVIFWLKSRDFQEKSSNTDYVGWVTSVTSSLRVLPLPSNSFLNFRFSTAKKWENDEEKMISMKLPSSRNWSHNFQDSSTIFAGLLSEINRCHSGRGGGQCQKHPLIQLNISLMEKSMTSIVSRNGNTRFSGWRWWRCADRTSQEDDNDKVGNKKCFIYIRSYSIEKNKLNLYKLKY